MRTRDRPATRVSRIRPDLDFVARRTRPVCFHQPHLSYLSFIVGPTLATVAMASGRDVRDMLGLPAGGDAPKAASLKRPKPAGGGRKIRTFGNSYVYPWEMVKRARLTLIRPEGVAREVAALYGERPPPVAVYEEKKAYRAKRQSTGPAKKWYTIVLRWWMSSANHLVAGYNSRL